MLKPFKDISEWIESRDTAEPDTLRAELEKMADAAPEWMPSPHQPAKQGLQFVSLGSLLAEPEEKVPFLVEDRLPMGGSSIVAAKPKTGKSTLARCLALSVARGMSWLGFKTQQGPVLYLALEEKRSEVKRHFMEMGANASDPISVFAAPSPEDGLAELRRAADQYKPVLIIIDPLLKFARVKDANDYAQVNKALEPVHNLARESGAHVLCVYHAGKTDRSGADAVLGSTAFAAAVDTILIMKRTDQYRTLSSVQRYGNDLEEITLSMDPETRWISAGLSRQEADEAEVAKAILDFLPGQEWVEEKVIHDAIDGRRAVKQRALRVLVDQQKVDRTGEGKRGSPYLYAVPGTQVPDIPSVPENQKEKSDINARKKSNYSGTHEKAFNQEQEESRAPESVAPEQLDLEASS